MISLIFGAIYGYKRLITKPAGHIITASGHATIVTDRGRIDNRSIILSQSPGGKLNVVFNDDFARSLKQIQEFLVESNISLQHKKEALQDLDAIESELRGRSPSAEKIAEYIKRIESIISTAGLLASSISSALQTIKSISNL